MAAAAWRQKSARDAYKFLAANEGKLVTYEEISAATGGTWSVGTVGNYRSKKWHDLLRPVGEGLYRVTGISEDEFVALQSQVSQAIIDPLVRLLDETIGAGEGQGIEFKASIPKSASDLATEIAAFASSNNGTILVGVTDDGGVVGYDGDRERIEHIASNVAPATTVNIKLVPYRGKQVALVRVLRGVEPIYHANGRPYVRQGTISRPATPDEVKSAVANYLDTERRAVSGSLLLSADGPTQLSITELDLFHCQWGFSPTNDIRAEIADRHRLVFHRLGEHAPTEVSYWLVGR